MGPPQLPLTDPAFVFVVLFAVILLAPLVAERARVPGIVGLILAGVVIGPNALGVLERTGPIEVLGGIGLLYLMFLAGVDLDLAGFYEHRRDSLIFGATTFVVPMVVNTAACLALGLELLPALLVASAFTSHTLVAYPVVQRYGLVKNRAVTATIGATLLATVAALLVLAVVAAAGRGDIGPLFWVTFSVSLALFLAATLWALPRLTRSFFAGLGQDRTVRFTFVLVAVFGVAALADMAGIEAIVGAFLAGLALNRFVPDGSVLMERLQFLGASLLIPLFLISTGMLIDPVVLLTDSRSLVLAVGLTVAALGGKWLAALPAMRILRFSRAELGVMTGLSGAQAAGALAAIIVGLDLGLVDEEVVNAVVVVILATCLIATQLTSRSAPRVKRPERRPVTLGEAVVVPVANPRTAEPLVKVAALVAASDSGSVFPVNILGFDASREQVDEHKAVTAEAEQVALRHGAEARSLVRIDASPTAGVLHTVVEGGATSVLIGWKGYANARENFFGGVIDAILEHVPVPVMVCRPGTDKDIRRVVLSLTAGDLDPAGAISLDLAVAVATRVARQADVPLKVVTEVDDARLGDMVASVRKSEIICDARKPAIALRSHTEEGDIVIIGTPPTRAGLGQNASRLARAVAGRTVVATVPRL
ncbi:MAG TPA: cation:proton antiporter [Egibacteraceae bacterium]|jgi:Kef-type K+ transport system membrane component KefB|nr:cation:proton antiporter [Egibacteraceae bacterium]